MEAGLLRTFKYALVAALAMMLPLAAAQAEDLLWQTNSAGSDVHIFNAQTGELVDRQVYGDHPHGIAWAPGADTVFISLEQNGRSHGELLWVNRTTLEIEHRLDVGPEPHAIAVTPDGKWVYVPCRDGRYWVVDSEKREVVAHIETGGRPHNTTAASNRLMLLSPMGSPKRVTLVDPSLDHHVLGTIEFSNSVRPPAIARDRNLFFQHVDGLNGFEVANLDTREAVARVEHSSELGLAILPASWGRLSLNGLNRCHGLGVQPGDRYIWSVCGKTVSVHDVSSSDYSEIAVIHLPSKGYWLTFSRSGDRAYVALSDADEVSVIDTANFAILRQLKAGKSPKRNLVIPRN